MSGSPRLSSNPCTAQGDWALHPEDLSQQSICLVELERNRSRRIVQQTQTRPVVTSIRPQVRVSVSHMWLLALFWDRQLLSKLPTICVCLQKARLIGLKRGRTGRQALGHPVATSHRPSARWSAPHLVHLTARRCACPFHKLRLFSSTLPRRAPGSVHGPAGTSLSHSSLA